MLCELCKTHSATLDSVEIVNRKELLRHLCHDCWKLLNQVRKAKVRHPSLNQHDFVNYESQMKLVPKLTRDAFQAVLEIRSSNPTAFFKKLCELSARFVFEEASKKYSRRSSRFLEVIQDCNREAAQQVEQFTRQAQSFTPKAYSNYRRILKQCVRDTLKKLAQ